jgi:hypothetical protein
MNCPCGCDIELVGRQKAASPACRKRVERWRKGVTREQRRANRDGKLSHFEPEPVIFRDKFEASPFHWPVEKRDFSDPAYEPGRDMTLQPVFCRACGGVLIRDYAYLKCRACGFNDFMQCIGCTTHPRNAEWEAYLDLNGREAHEAASERVRASKRLFWR